MNRRIRRRRPLQHPDITLTPLIDTALTLLIIFMVTTPMIQNAIKVNLPKGNVQEAGNSSPELVVYVDAKGTIYFNNKPVKLETLSDKIKTYIAEKPAMREKSVWVKIDTVNSCGLFAQIYEQVSSVKGLKDVKMALERTAAIAA